MLEDGHDEEQQWKCIHGSSKTHPRSFSLESHLGRAQVCSGVHAPGLRSLGNEFILFFFLILPSRTSPYFMSDSIWCLLKLIQTKRVQQENLLCRDTLSIPSTKTTCNGWIWNQVYSKSDNSGQSILKHAMTPEELWSDRKLTILKNWIHTYRTGLGMLFSSVDQSLQFSKNISFRVPV